MFTAVRVACEAGELLVSAGLGQHSVLLAAMSMMAFCFLAGLAGDFVYERKGLVDIT